MKKEIELGQGKIATYAFRVEGQETFIDMSQGGDSVTFQITIPDYKGKSNVSRKPLPKELRIAATAEAIVSGIVSTSDLSRINGQTISNGPAFVRQNFVRVASNSSFSQIPCKVRHTRPQAIWAVRISAQPKAQAA